MPSVRFLHKRACWCARTDYCGGLSSGSVGIGGSTGKTVRGRPGRRFGVSEGAATKLASAAIRRRVVSTSTRERKKLSTSARKNTHERPIFVPGSLPLLAKAKTIPLLVNSIAAAWFTSIVSGNAIWSPWFGGLDIRLSPAARSFRINRQSCFTGLLRFKVTRINHIFIMFYRTPF